MKGLVRATAGGWYWCFCGDIDGDGVGDSMVTLVTGVFVTNIVGVTG